MKSASWVTCRALRTVGDDGQVAYPPAGDRVFPRNAPISSLKFLPENIPRYFPHGEMAVTNLIEGQLAFLQHVHLYEEKHRGTHILQTRLLWKYELLRCCFGCLPREELQGLSREIDEISGMNHRFTSWSVKTSKLLSAVLRHNSSVTLGKYLEASIEDLHTQTKLRCFDWEPKKFFAFLAANSKSRFSIWISPAALTFPRFYDWDFVIGIGAIQGHTRIPEVVSEEALGERLTIERSLCLRRRLCLSRSWYCDQVREFRAARLCRLLAAWTRALPHLQWRGIVVQECCSNGLDASLPASS